MSGQGAGRRGRGGGGGTCPSGEAHATLKRLPLLQELFWRRLSNERPLRPRVVVQQGDGCLEGSKRKKKRRSLRKRAPFSPSAWLASAKHSLQAEGLESGALPAGTRQNRTAWECRIGVRTSPSFRSPSDSRIQDSCGKGSTTAPPENSLALGLVTQVTVELGLLWRKGRPWPLPENSLALGLVTQVTVEFRTPVARGRPRLLLKTVTMISGASEEEEVLFAVPTSWAALRHAASASKTTELCLHRWRRERNSASPQKKKTNAINVPSCQRLMYDAPCFDACHLTRCLLIVSQRGDV